jgi:hypothetical protein
MNFAVPPALTKNPSLDSDALASPFTNRSDFKKKDEVKKGPKTLVRVEAEMGDHPNSSAKLEYANEATHALNFMFNMRLDLELTTVFVARENITQPLQPLAHFGWHLVWDARFSWKAGAPTGVVVNGRLDAGGVKKGQPADPNVQSLLTKPVPPFYNDLIRDATKEVLTKGKPPNRVMDKDRDKEIPADFFT